MTLEMRKYELFLQQFFSEFLFLTLIKYCTLKTMLKKEVLLRCSVFMSRRPSTFRELWTTDGLPTDGIYRRQGNYNDYPKSRNSEKHLRENRVFPLRTLVRGL